MEPFVGIIALIMIFGPGFYAVKRVFDLKEQREKRLTGGVDPAVLEAVREERRLLQERVENLEAIVCDVDFELNRRIAAIADQPALLAAGGKPARVGEPSASRTAGQPASDDPAGEAATAGGSPDESEVSAPAGPTLTSPGRRAGRPGPQAGVRVVAGELTAGDTLAERYRVERLIGRGGMGAVYLAHDEVLGEDVALKVISSAWAVDERAMLDRLRREVSAARRIASPNVIRIHDLGEAKGVLYISMEYVAGQTLAEVMEAARTLDSASGRQLLRGVCDGLSAAHAAGVIHRDLKPHNVLVGDDGVVKIIDFGLAKAAFIGRMTATGVLLGTPHYMSPEQVRGGDIDERADIYSLGAMTYHAMTGVPPFDGPNPIAIGFAHCHDEPVPPRKLRPGISAKLNDAVLAALAKSPDDRPRSAADFRRALT